MNEATIIDRLERSSMGPVFGGQAELMREAAAVIAFLRTRRDGLLEANNRLVEERRDEEQRSRSAILRADLMENEVHRLRRLLSGSTFELADSERAWKRRAEAAEAQLAKLAPAGVVTKADAWDQMANAAARVRASTLRRATRYFRAAMILLEDELKKSEAEKPDGA